MGRMESTADDFEPIPGVTDDPVIQLILSGRAKNLDEAEEIYLDESLPRIVELIGSGLSQDELMEQPLMKLMLARGTRRWEDSLGDCQMAIAFGSQHSRGGHQHPPADQRAQGERNRRPAEDE